MTKLSFRSLIPVILLVVLYNFAFAQAPVISYQTPQSLLINNAITPIAPSNTGGAVPATIYGQVSTFAGSNKTSILPWPTGIAFDAAGNLFVAVFDDNNVVEIPPSGVISVFAGNQYKAGFVNGQGLAASFYEPMD